MVIANFSVDAKGQFLGKSDRVKRSMFESMTKHWGNMRDEGRITQVRRLFSLVKGRSHNATLGSDVIRTSIEGPLYVRTCRYVITLFSRPQHKKTFDYLSYSSQ